MTPVEFRREIRVAEMRARDEHKRDLALAWYHATLTAQAARLPDGRPGRLPSLATLFRRLDAVPSRPPTLPLTDLAMLSDHLGIALRPISPEAKAALERLAARG